MQANENAPRVWKETPLIWLSLAILSLLLGLLFFDSLQRLVDVWNSREEYSYGYLIPPITAFLLWQRKNRLERAVFSGSWAGVVVVFLGLVLLIIGNLSAIYLAMEYAFLVVLAGIALAMMGGTAFKIVAAPLGLLIFMIPLPEFLFQEISSQLQLISSQIGVWFIRLLNISVFLEGNVIDLGSYKLQVVEACSGLRYLFPLMALGFIVAYFYNAPLWKRVVIFLSTIPITVFMNSFRIGAIGILVEYWGSSMATGFLHDFEGWVVFMACTGVLIAEIWLLSRLGGDKRPLREVFGIDFPQPRPAGAILQARSIPRPFIAASLLVLIGVATSYALPQRVELQQARADFSTFPMSLGSWQGEGGKIESIYLDVLQLDDYILADYHRPAQPGVNLYVAYYATQRKGQATHSPRTCIPGGGWQIVSLDRYAVANVTHNGRPLMVNRTFIKMGDYRQLVYYWFEQRGRDLTNEYAVRWYIFWDALTRNRTDGALVRLTTEVPVGEDIADADRRLAEFAQIASPQLKEFVPE